MEQPNERSDSTSVGVSLCHLSNQSSHEGLWFRYLFKYYHRPIFSCTLLLLCYGERDSVVGMTRYGLDLSKFEPRSERDFPHPRRPALRLYQLRVQWSPHIFHGGKADGE